MPEFMRQPPDWLQLLLWLSFVLVVLRVLVFLVPALPLWVGARMTGTPIGFPHLIGLQLRGGTAGMRKVFSALVIATRQGGGPTAAEVEGYHLAGGDVIQAAKAFAEARQAGLDLTWQEAAALQLDGRDVLAAVREAAQSGNRYKLDQLVAGVRQKPDSARA